MVSPRALGSAERDLGTATHTPRSARGRPGLGTGVSTPFGAHVCCRCIHLRPSDGSDTKYPGSLTSALVGARVARGTAACELLGFGSTLHGEAGAAEVAFRPRRLGSRAPEALPVT